APISASPFDCPSPFLTPKTCFMKIVNITPHAMSGESHQDSGSSIAVNPHNPNEIVIGAYTPDPNGVGRAPVYVSTNGGSTWTLKSSLPSNGPEGTSGITLK